MIPATLDEWTYEVVARLCEPGLSEGETHDFKARLTEDGKERGNIEKLCCAFANTRGGFVVLGVADGARRFPLGLPRDTEFYGKFIAKVRTEPQIEIPPPRLVDIPDSDHVLYVFHIPQSSRRPHIPSISDRRAFWKRVGSSCERMTREEVRSQIMDDEGTRAKLGLLLLELRNIEWSLGMSASNVLTSPYDGTLYSFEIIDRVTVEAYGLLKHDPQTVRVLATLKHRLMRMNAVTNRFLTQASHGTAPSLTFTTTHSSEAKSTLGEVTLIREQIERSFRERFGIDI